MGNQIYFRVKNGPFFATKKYWLLSKIRKQKKGGKEHASTRRLGLIGFVGKKEVEETNNSFLFHTHKKR